MLSVNKTSYQFCGEALYGDSARWISVIRCWPDLSAKRRGHYFSQWHEFSPNIRITPADYAERQTCLFPRPDESGDKVHQNEMALSRFSQTIPSPARNIIAQYRVGHWGLLKACKRHPAIMEMMADHPALAFCVVFGNEITRRATAFDPNGIWRLVRLTRRAILQRIGLPGGKSMVKILEKVDPSMISVGTLRRLRICAADPGMFKLLLHVPKINREALNVLADPRMRRHVTPKLMEEIAIGAKQEGNKGGSIYHTLKNINELAGWVDAEALSRQLKSHDEAKKFYHELNEKMTYQENMETWGAPLPPSPVPGNENIIPLTTPEDLEEEGRLQRHCVTSHKIYVAIGHVYVYRVIYPERATLSLVKNGKRWRPHQLLAASNKPVRDETRQYVTNWLSDWNKRMES